MSQQQRALLGMSENYRALARSLPDEAAAIRLRLPSAMHYPDADCATMIAVALKRLDFVPRGL